MADRLSPPAGLLWALDAICLTSFHSDELKVSTCIWCSSLIWICLRLQLHKKNQRAMCFFATTQCLVIFSFFSYCQRILWKYLNQQQMNPTNKNCLCSRISYNIFIYFCETDHCRLKDLFLKIHITFTSSLRTIELASHREGKEVKR